MASESPPIYEAAVEPSDPKHPLAKKLPRFTFTVEWIKYLGFQASAIDTKPTRKAQVKLTGQAASIGVTAIPMSLIPPGMYRVCYYARIVVPAGVSSSLTVTIGWTDGGVAQSASGAAIAGNTTTSMQFGSAIIRVDADTPISYSTTYASNPAAAMEYQLDIVLEELALD